MASHLADVQANLIPTNTKLFSMLALLNAYVPDSYLIMEECQQILGPPDPIHGGPPFEDRMKPFSDLLRVSGSRVDLVHPDIAMRCLELFADLLNIRRSSVADDCIYLLCGEQAQPDTVHLVKDLLTKREMGQKGKEKFSYLIQDIITEETFGQALRVLKNASNKFKDKHIFPQTVARLYYIGGSKPNFKKAEIWAKEAIKRAQNNSYAADTLGQVYKNHLLKKATLPYEIKGIAEKAFEAFRDVENKAQRELGRELSEWVGYGNFSDGFNNRGHFGFIQVAKIISGKYRHLHPFKQSLKSEVEDKFEFFEWYLNYSKLDKITVEPDYFWKDVATCYKAYTGDDAADSTSFPALVDCLNHGLFVSKERRAKFSVTEKTQSDLEQIRDELKTDYENNVDDVQVAERYVLSNIILSNKVPDSPQQPLVRELQQILQRFLSTGVHESDPEFYLLVLLLFWPEENPRTGEENDNEELNTPETEEDQLQDQPSEEVIINKDDPGENPERPPLGLIFDPDLEHCVTLMEKTYDNVYGKYLRGRYLLPLFFLGKGRGLSRWIHRSRLDAVVQRHVETESDNDPSEPNPNKTKRKKINHMWKSGDVWELSEIQNMLQPIQIETTQEEAKVTVCAGGKKITSRIDDKPLKSPVRFYLGFNIRGPVVFYVGAPLNASE
ncbi:sterile alpha motif domain-containing protein 9-like [Fundulus heteroclitus]|uniref:sterile alpha motif domain-containing protein 9-like n=1 Tax=Fundulus heteroclitus TaxID=8078 RepID=UPI00165CA864|nr:sterile alpha motif domain-containing protein 9-like [Fundulus heteroclitus]XP_036001959.1 sterile alpha motif domain-containing protein 9-like [Fundulus heteroclitus]